MSSFIELSKKLDDTYRIILVGLTQEQIKSLPKVLLEKTLQPTYIVSKTEKTEQEILQSMKSSNMTLIQRNPSLHP